MADWLLIRRAIASNLSGVSGIRKATADDLDVVSMAPEIKVTNVSNLNVADRGAGYEYVVADINADLYVYRPGDLGRSMAEVDPLVEGVRVRMRDGVQLGFPGTVQDSSLVSAESGDMTLGEDTYMGAKLSIRVEVRENVTRTA